MVKEVSVSREVPGYSPQLYFDAVYGGSDCIRRFHLEVNKTNDTTFTEWAGGQRVVTFTQPVQAPAFLKRIIGVDDVKVTETQAVDFNPDGTIALSSTPVPNIPGGSKFVTRIDVSLSISAHGGCLVRSKVVCSASGPYGMTGTIESFMAETAKSSLLQWLDFICSYLQELKEAAAPVAALAAGAVAAAAAAVEEEEGPALAAEEAAPAEEQFFDAEEQPGAQGMAAPQEEEEDRGPAIPAAPADLPAEAPLVPSAPLSSEDAMLLYLRYMCRTGDQSCALLESLDRRLRSLERDMAAIRGAVVEEGGGRGEGGGALRSGARQQALAQQHQQQQGVQQRQQPPAQQQQPQQPAQRQQQHQQKEDALSFWSRPVSMQRAVIGAGLLATTSVGLTVLYFSMRQRPQR